jgi:alkylmercury lyase
MEEKTRNQTNKNVSIQQALDKIRTDAFENIVSDQNERRIVSKTLELLANGRPVLPDEIAMLAHVSQEKVLSTLHGFGAEFDKEGNVVGLGLTLVPTTHVYQINDRKLYTWCAVDALVFPIMLGHTAQIESRDPVTGEKIQVAVSPDGVQRVKPKSAVVSWVNAIDLSNVRGSGCQYIHFFSSTESVSKWIARHPGKTFYLVNNDVYRAVIQLQNKRSDMQTKGCC